MDIWWCWNLPRLYNEQHLTLSQPVSVQDFLHQEYHCSQVQISTKATQNKHLRRGKSSNVQNLWYWASCISSPHNFLFRDSTNQPTPAQTTQPNPWPSNEYIFVSTFPPFPPSQPGSQSNASPRGSRSGHKVGMDGSKGATEVPNIRPSKDFQCSDLGCIACLLLKAPEDFELPGSSYSFFVLFCCLKENLERGKGFKVFAEIFARSAKNSSYPQWCWSPKRILEGKNPKFSMNYPEAFGIQKTPTWDFQVKKFDVHLESLGILEKSQPWWGKKGWLWKDQRSQQVEQLWDFTTRKSFKWASANCLRLTQSWPIEASSFWNFAWNHHFSLQKRSLLSNHCPCHIKPCSSWHSSLHWQSKRRPPDPVAI